MKKGSSSIATVLFVLISLGLFLASLVALSLDIEKTKANVENGRSIERAYAKENELEYLARAAGQKVMEDGLDATELRLRLQEGLSDIRQDDIPSRNFASRIKNGEFEIAYDGNYTFRMDDFVIMGELGEDGWKWLEEPQEDGFRHEIIYRTNITAIIG